MSITARLGQAGNSARIVAYCDDRPVTLGQFRSDILKNAVALKERRCRRGILVTSDTYWAAVGLLALFHAGAIVVMPNNVLPKTLSDFVSGDAILVSDTEVQGIDACHLLTSSEDGDSTIVLPDPAICQIKLFTSGSSGDPVSSTKCLRQMEREAVQLEKLFGPYLAPDAAILGTVTHQHLYGLAYRLFWPLCAGRPFHGRTYAIWEALPMQALASTAIVTGPAQLARIAGIPPIDAAGRPGAIFSAGAPLPETALAGAKEIFGAPIIEIYGSTETNTIAWREAASPTPPWMAFPDVKVARLPDGRISLQSPYLSASGPFDGQDLIRLEGEGRFHLLGRADRIAKIEGKRISLSEVERALRAHPFVSELGVVVLEDEKPSLGAVVVLSDAGREQLAVLGKFRLGRKIRQDLAECLEPAGQPRRWRFVDALPVNAMGKVIAEELRNLLESVTNEKPTEPDIRGVETGDHWVEIELFNRADLQQLDGHFPAVAIVPGVAQIDWAVKFAARYLHLSLETATKYQVKFHRLTLSETTSLLRLEHDPARQRLAFAYRKPNQDVLTSGTIFLGVA